MLKHLYAWVKQLLLLSRDTQQNCLDIREIREELDLLTSSVKKLTFEMQRIRERVEHIQALETSEREKMALRLENEMLRFERRLLVDGRDKGSEGGSPAGGFEAS